MQNVFKRKEIDIGVEVTLNMCIWMFKGLLQQS